MKKTFYILLSFLSIILSGCNKEEVNNSNQSNTDFYSLQTPILSTTQAFVPYSISGTATPGIRLAVKESSSIPTDCIAFFRDVTGVESSSRTDNNGKNNENGFYITGLKPNTTYYYAQYVEDNYGGRIYSTVLSFKTLEENFVNIEISDVTAESATVNAIACESLKQQDYYLNLYYWEVGSGSKLLITNNKPINNLDYNKEYEVWAEVKIPYLGIIETKKITFITGDYGVEFSNVKATDITPTSVKLEADISTKESFGKTPEIEFYFGNKASDVYNYRLDGIKNGDNKYYCNFTDFYPEERIKFKVSAKIDNIHFDSEEVEFEIPKPQISIIEGLGEITSASARVCTRTNTGKNVFPKIYYRKQGDNYWQSVSSGYDDEYDVFVGLINSRCANTTYEYYASWVKGSYNLDTDIFKFTTPDVDISISNIEIAEIEINSVKINSKTSAKCISNWGHEISENNYVNSRICYRIKGSNDNYKTSAEKSGGSLSTHSLYNLVENTEYEFYVLASCCGKEKKSELYYFKTKELNRGQAIDLGLSIKWSNMNLGADNPEDYGNTYNMPDEISFSIVQTKYDYAMNEWGGLWRMPTESEAKELIEKCSWKYLRQNGVFGFLATGPNNNSIFFPLKSGTVGFDMWTGTFKKKTYDKEWDEEDREYYYTYYYWFSILSCYLDDSRNIITEIGIDDDIQRNIIRPVQDK